MLSKLLPNEFVSIFSKIDNEKLQEIRLRVNCPIMVLYDSNKYFLSGFGLCNDENRALKCTPQMINHILLKCSNYSLYSISEELKKGYITLNDGVRIGVAGEYVIDNYNLKNISSLNIRIPHQVLDCAKDVFDKLFYEEEFLNTLIISPPGAGKTTLLRDLSRQFFNRKQFYNICIVDERNEIASLKNGSPLLNLGQNVDVIANASKNIAINNAIRSLNPDIILTDEIGDSEDIVSLKNCVTCGVKFIATLHGRGVNDLKTKYFLSILLKEQLVKRFIILSKNERIGKIKMVLDENFNEI